jgi:hypothetical protein
MAIEIIDGFKVSSAVPVDNRIVASGSTARNAIPYKYNGLRVYDTFDSIPYVWLNNTWKKENETSLSVAPNITPGYTSTSNYKVGQVLKVFNDQKLLTNSNMYEVEFLTNTGQISGRTIAINHISGGINTPASVSSTARLDVNGSIKATSFEGSGANITNIDPANFNTTTNKINISQIQPGTVGFILQTTSTGLDWVSLATAYQPSALTATLEVNSSNVHYLTFVPAIQGGTLHTYNTSDSSGDKVFGVVPSTGQIVVKNDNTPSTPAYSFKGESNTGIYRSSAGSMAFSILGNKKVEIDTNGIKISQGDATNPGISFIGGNNYGFYKSTTGSNRIGIVVSSAEMIRIKSTSQGYGNTTIYGDANVLTLQGRSSNFIEFFRTGSEAPDTVAIRTAYLGFSTTNNDFIIANQAATTNISLLSTGRINISTKVIATSGYGSQISNLSGDSGNGLAILSSYTATQAATPSGCNVAAFLSRVGTGGTDTYHIWITRQGIELGGNNGTGGTETLPAIYVTGKPSTGIYSPTTEYSGNALAISAGGGTKMIVNKNGVKMAAFESQQLGIPSFVGVSNASSSNNTFNGSNSACVNAVYKTSTSNSGSYTARWIYLGFKFSNYTYYQSSSVPLTSKSVQYVIFASDTCDRIFYVGAGGSSPSNFYGYEAKFYFGGPENGNYLGRFLSNNGASGDIYNGTGTFYVPANHTFTIALEWYTNGTAVNDTSTEGGFGLTVRAFRMGLSNVLNNGSF